MTHHDNQQRCWWLRGLVLAAVTVCTGCSHIQLRGMQTDHPRSLEELFYEAEATRTRYPENSVNPYPGEVVSPHAPLDPSFPPPPPAMLPIGQASVPSFETGAIRRVAATSAEAGGILTAQGFAPPLTDGGPRVSEIFEDTDVRQAIQSLATQAGLSVVVDEQIGGVTSAIIENEPFEQALRKVLMPLGLVYKYHEGQFLVGLPDPASALFPIIAETFEFRPQHLAPAELLPLLPERLQVFVRVIEKRNLMIVEAPHETAVRIVEQLQQSDQPVSQVLLEAIVCVFNPDQKFNFNADLRQSLNLDGKDVLDIGTLGLAMNGFISPIGLEKAFSDFAKTSVLLRALAQEGYVTIRAAPRVMAKDGEKATISIARETYFALYPQNTDSTNSIFFPQNVQKVDAGIVLDIVPVIRGDMVTVTIEKAEVSEDIREFDQSTENLISNFPLINRRQVSTTVHVKDGQTIVIGGLMQRQTVDRLSSVPYLHSIPLIGKLFERIDQEDKSAEVAIFISPRIVRPAVLPVACPPGEVLMPGPDEYPAPALLPPPTATPTLPPPSPSMLGPSQPVMPYMPPAAPPSIAPLSPAPQPVPSSPPANSSESSPPPVPEPSAAPATITPVPITTPPVSSASSDSQPTLSAAPSATSSDAGPPTELKFVMPKPAVPTTPAE